MIDVKKAARRAFRGMYSGSAEIFSLAEGSSYSSEAVMKSEGEIAADVQPMSGSVSELAFGLAAEGDSKMYCDEHDALVVGNFVKTGGVLYRIERADRRELGMTVYLKRSDAYGNQC